MFDLRRIPIIRVLLPFAGGAGGAVGLLHMGRMPDPALQAMQVWLLLILFVIGILQLLTYGRTQGLSRFGAWLFSLWVFSFFFLAGCLSGLVSRPVDPGLPLGKKILIRGELTEGPSPGTNSWSYGMKTDMLCIGDSAFGLRTHLKVYLKPSSPSDSLAGLPGPGRPGFCMASSQPFAAVETRELLIIK